MERELKLLLKYGRSHVKTIKEYHDFQAYCTELGYIITPATKYNYGWDFRLIVKE